MSRIQQNITGMPVIEKTGQLPFQVAQQLKNWDRLDRTTRNVVFHSLRHVYGVNAADTETGETSLIIAISHNQTALRQVLIKIGADVEQRDNKGLTPFMYAGLCDDVQAGQELIAAGADPAKRHIRLGTAVMIAAKKASWAFVKAFQGSGDDRNAYGDTLSSMSDRIGQPQRTIDMAFLAAHGL